MAFVLNFNPNPAGVFKDKIFLTKLNLNYTNPNGGAQYPTRIKRATNPEASPPHAGFLNLLVITTTDRDEEAILATKQFLLRIVGRKTFVLKSTFLPFVPATEAGDSDTPAKLLIWFIAKWKSGDPEFSTDGIVVTTATTLGVGDLTITIETDEGFLDTPPVKPPAEA